MAEKVFLVHGWSVTETTTYQALHHKLDDDNFVLHDVLLGRYVSLDDHVEIKDIAAAMHNALQATLGKQSWKDKFHIITHSTGALVVKEWLAKYYRGKYAANHPLKNVVFLAGPHFGSRLAHHGRSMIAHARYFGPTGNKVLTDLELGSTFSWENNEWWMKQSNWKDKEIFPFCLTGDKVVRSFFKSKIFPAGYERGSDEVVRVPSANLNFRRIEINGVTGETREIGEVSGVAFGALQDYVHSGRDNGIMNSIVKSADPRKPKYLNLKLILECLKVKDSVTYETTRKNLALQTRRTRAKRRAFSQLDFRLRDDTGSPITDYRFELGYVKGGSRHKASKTVVNIHKNKAEPGHRTLFIDHQEFEPNLTYFLNFHADSGTSLFDYRADKFPIQRRGKELTNIIVADRTTQIDVILGREPGDNLFVFHTGDDPDLHVKWNRDGEIIS